MVDYTYRNVEEVLELSSQEMEQVQGGANVDYFLKIPGVEGESTDDRARTHVGGGGGGAGKVSMQDFHF